jgi:uracil-DNA glycosylase family 4
MPARVVLIGAGPGKHEARSYRCYSGPAGDELENTYLAIAGLDREEDCWIGNCVLCYDGQNKTPDENRARRCAAYHLPRVLAASNPDVLVLMGGVACRIADKRLRLDFHHGFPVFTSVLDGAWEGWVFPSFEPALGIRDTPQMRYLLEDFRNLGLWLEGDWVPPTLDGTAEEAEGERDYALVRTVADLDDYLGRYGDMRGYRSDGGPVYIRPAVDTERHGRDPWSVQFSTAPRTGRMLLSPNSKYADTGAQEVLSAFQARVRSARAVFDLHNCGQDLDTLEKMGIVPASFYDTQQEAYQLCSLPQGLKSLAHRLRGVVMRSWQDVVWPASVDAVADWMREGIALAAAENQDVVQHTLKLGVCADCGHQHKPKAKAARKTKKAVVAQLTFGAMEVDTSDLILTPTPCKQCGCEGMEQVYTRMEYKPSAVEKILKHVLDYTGKTKDDDEPYHPWEKLAEMKGKGLRGKKTEGWEWDWLDEALGKMPILGIGNCELQETVDYGCSDADRTGLVAADMAVMRGSERWRIDEADRDV